MVPPVCLNGRVAGEDGAKLGGHKVPKDVFVINDIFGVHNDPEVWPEPRKYDPDRFDTEPKVGAWQPFGMGPKDCLGKHFAMLEIKF